MSTTPFTPTDDEEDFDGREFHNPNHPMYIPSAAARRFAYNAMQDLLGQHGCHHCGSDDDECLYATEINEKWYWVCMSEDACADRVAAKEAAR